MLFRSTLIGKSRKDLKVRKTIIQTFNCAYSQVGATTPGWVMSTGVATTIIGSGATSHPSAAGTAKYQTKPKEKWKMGHSRTRTHTHKTSVVKNKHIKTNKFVVVVFRAAHWSEN